MIKIYVILCYLVVVMNILLEAASLALVILRGAIIFFSAKFGLLAKPGGILAHQAN